jgi:hypothetical protein
MYLAPPRSNYREAKARVINPGFIFMATPEGALN